MLGKNKTRDKEWDTPRSLQVQDIWYTIQGEGPSAGVPSFFIRMTGCNLKCYYCDTNWDDEKDPYIHILDIFCTLDKLKEKYPNVKLIVITGGEPTRQNLTELIEGFIHRGFTIEIETAGTFWQECFRAPEVHLIVSPKNDYVHSAISTNVTVWKYVVSVNGYKPEAIREGLPTINPQRDGGNGNLYQPPYGNVAPIYISPCDEGLAEKNANRRLALDIVLSSQKYRLSIQMHKIVGAK